MPYITAENARELARRSHLPTSARNRPKIAEAVPEKIEQPASDFRDKILIRVRMNIEETMAMLEKEDDPKARESLSRSLGVLLEHEGHLSGRPRSGIAKPGPPKPQRKITSYPEPVPQFDVIEDATPVVVESTTNTTVQGDWSTVLF